MVAGDEHDRSAGHRLAQLLEEGPDAAEHACQRQFAQLERVAEQDKAVGARYLLEERCPDRRVAEQVLAEGAAQVQVGDDRRAQGANLDGGYHRLMSGLSEERLAPANGIEIAYQEIGEPDAEPMLLIMGLGTQMLGWDEGFCAMLAERGFRVVRFDNRDIGHSTMIEGAGMPTRMDMLRGRRATAPYLLSDMADDAFGLMDHLGFESAHVVGVSMGGMIAQTMAILRPERVLSLASMLSTTGNRRLGWPDLEGVRRAHGQVSEEPGGLRKSGGQDLPR